MKQNALNVKLWTNKKIKEEIKLNKLFEIFTDRASIAWRKKLYEEAKRRKINV